MPNVLPERKLGEPFIKAAFGACLLGGFRVEASHPIEVIFAFGELTYVGQAGGNFLLVDLGYVHVEVG